MDYQKLYEKYARREKLRAWLTLASSAAGALAAVMMLREIRADRATA